MIGEGSGDFVFEIDLNNITKSIVDFKKVEKAIDRGIEKGQLIISTELAKKMISYLGEFGLGGSNLAGTIQVIPEGTGFTITVGADYGIYVEYGTGIVGASNPHPHPWAYDTHQTPEAHKNGGWFYKGDDGRRHWTAGQPSKPFMYLTWLYGTRSAKQMMQKCINEEVAKVLGGKK